MVEKISSVGGQNDNSAIKPIEKEPEGFLDRASVFIKNDWNNFTASMHRTWNQTASAWANSDIAQLCRGDFAGFWEIQKNSSIGRLCQGNFRQAWNQFCLENRNIENALGLNFIKNPFREEQAYLERLADDGNPKNFTAAEKIVRFVGDGGKVADELTTPAGLASMLLAGPVLKAAGSTAEAGITYAADTLRAAGYVRTATAVTAAPAVVTTVAAADGTRRIVESGIDIYNAETPEEVDLAFSEGLFGVGEIALAATAAAGAKRIAARGGIPVTSEDSVLSVPIRAVTTPSSEIMANAETAKTGIIQQGATVLKKGLHKVREMSPEGVAHRFDIQGSTPEEILAKNCRIQFDAETGEYFVETLSKGRMPISPEKRYVALEYGSENFDLVEEADFFKNFVESRPYLSNGRKTPVSKSILDEGGCERAVRISDKQFKIMPEGTRFMSEQGVTELQAESVLMVDSEGTVCQSTVENLFRNHTGFSEEAIEALSEIKPDAPLRAEVSAFRAKFAETSEIDPDLFDVAKNGLTKANTDFAVETYIRSGGTGEGSVVAGSGRAFIAQPTSKKGILYYKPFTGITDITSPCGLNVVGNSVPQYRSLGVYNGGYLVRELAPLEEAVFCE